jgi:putative ABC transport system ATP-binding protein
MNIIIKNLNKQYKEHKIFENFSLEIPAGKLTAIHGVSGSGKTTLLNIIGLIEDFDTGDLYLGGEKSSGIYSRKSLLLRRNLISYLFQNFALLEDESIEKNLAVPLIYSKISKKEKQKKMREVLAKVNIRHSLKTKVYSLSGGEKQRVALARALLKDSEIILADEPTGSVDKGNRDEILRLLRAEAENGKTVIIVTHDSEIVAQADYVVKI